MPFQSPEQRAEVREILVRLLEQETQPPEIAHIALVDGLLDAVAWGGLRPDLGPLPAEVHRAALVLAYMDTPAGVVGWVSLFRIQAPWEAVDLGRRRARERAADLVVYIEDLPYLERERAQSWIRVLRAGRVPLVRPFRERPPAGQVFPFGSKP